MKNCILLLLACLPASAQLASTNLLPEAVCGFGANRLYAEADSVRQGLDVNMFVGPVRAGQPATLRFFANKKPGDFAVNDLQVEHEKLMHIIGVRDDLGNFFHIHPQKVGPGQWVATYTFPQPGIYKIWTDVKYWGVSCVFAQKTLVVTGSATSAPPASAPSYDVKPLQPLNLLAGVPNRMDFSIRDAAGNQVPTENFLGAPMHLIIIKDDLSVYLHAHPLNHGTTDPVVHFAQIFPQPGRYRMFLQFRPEGANLPPDAAILKEISVDVPGLHAAN